MISYLHTILNAHQNEQASVLPKYSNPWWIVACPNITWCWGLSQEHFEFWHWRKTDMVFTISFLDWQKDWRWLSLTSPESIRKTPYACNLRMSREMGDCKAASHQAGGSKGVRAHWWGWLWQLNRPANLFQTCPHPTWFPKPPASKLLWKLLKNENFEAEELSPGKRTNHIQINSLQWIQWKKVWMYQVVALLPMPQLVEHK